MRAYGESYAPLTNGNTLMPGEVAVLFFNRFGSSGGIGFLNFNCPTGITPATTTTDGAIHGTPLRGVTLAVPEPIGVIGLACGDERHQSRALHRAQDVGLVEQSQPGASR